MTIEAQIVEDSISKRDGIRLTTFQLRYPRFIHAELMTHRVFSRNASSSRAIPILRMIRDIRRDPAMPIHWGANQSGMQARAELSGWRLKGMKVLWLLGMWIMTTLAMVGSRLGAHKQIVNRLIEPWAHISVIVTATQWDNFWELRCHPDAQPEIRDLAEKMRKCYNTSDPRVLKFGEWHLPYVLKSERENLQLATQIKISTARCARVSYLTHDGKTPSVAADIKLHDGLVVAVPIHASPAEHQATPDEWSGLDGWMRKRLHGNFIGWCQYRKWVEQGVHAERIEISAA